MQVYYLYSSIFFNTLFDFITASTCYSSVLLLKESLSVARFGKG